MNKIYKFAGIAVAALGVTAGGALAADLDDYDYGRRHVRSDYGRLERDAAHVREERSELAAAHRKWRWARWHGDYWAARRAEHQIREERAELYAAKRKYRAQREDLYDDSQRLSYDYHPRRHWWWHN